MLGRFLEFSIPTPDIRASLDFYETLGFSAVSVGEAWTHPYAVVTDGRIFLGLHARSLADASMTFVKPGLLEFSATLDSLGVALEVRRLGDEVFHEVGWRDPSGLLIRLIEARTFSPSTRTAMETSICGYFLEIALPTPDPPAAKHFWERYGWVVMDEPDAVLPHLACTGDTIAIGLYEPASIPVPTLLFEVEDPGKTRTRLAALGLAVGRVPPALRTTQAMMLTAPEGTAILLLP